MPGGIEHLGCLKAAGRNNDQHANLPAVPRVANCEKEPDEGEGTQPFNRHRKALRVWPVFNRADGYEDQSGEQQPSEGAGSLGHRSEGVRMRG